MPGGTGVVYWYGAAVADRAATSVAARKVSRFDHQSMLFQSMGCRGSGRFRWPQRRPNAYPRKTADNRRAVEIQALNRTARTSSGSRGNARKRPHRPTGTIADPAHGLPGELRLAGADVQVIRREPLAIGTQRDPALDADDAVPVAQLDLGGTGTARRRDRADVAGDVPAQRLRDVEQRAPASTSSVAAGSATACQVPASVQPQPFRSYSTLALASAGIGRPPMLISRKPDWCCRCPCKAHR